MKFTEEEYKEIVYMFSVAGDSEEETRLVAEYVSSINHSSDYYKALALANPLTREWAHEQFVEEEKKYVWTSKKSMVCNGVEKYKRLFRKSDGDVAGFLTEKDAVVYEDHLTETEVRERGYNPEMFDKEEVE